MFFFMFKTIRKLFVAGTQSISKPLGAVEFRAKTADVMPLRRRLFRCYLAPTVLFIHYVRKVRSVRTHFTRCYIFRQYCSGKIRASRAVPAIAIIVHFQSDERWCDEWRLGSRYCYRCTKPCFQHKINKLNETRTTYVVLGTAFIRPHIGVYKFYQMKIRPGLCTGIRP